MIALQLFPIPALLVPQFPILGILLMIIVGAPWSPLLVNLGMIGISIEALTRRVTRGWLIVPIVFYGGYWSVAGAERLILSALRATNDAKNTRIDVSFNPAEMSLVLPRDAEWLVRNFDLPVAYAPNPMHLQEYVSTRFIDFVTCDAIAANPEFKFASVTASQVRMDGVASVTGGDPCLLSMPETPVLPLVLASQRPGSTSVLSVPVRSITTSISLPNEHRHELAGGTANLLHWFVSPIIGCDVGSARPAWRCTFTFVRSRGIPVVSDYAGHRHDWAPLARALGLQPKPVAEREASDGASILAKAAAVVEARLARELASLDAIIADPTVRPDTWQVELIASRPAVLAERAEEIMINLERLAGPVPSTGDSRNMLAWLISALPREDFLRYGPRLLALYADAGERHWLWGSWRLVSRIGELGIDAVPVLASPHLRAGQQIRPGIEGLCRIGAPSLPQSKSFLLTIWEDPRSKERESAYVAMRRIGIPVPPLSEDKHGQFARFEAYWADVSPSSPPDVCAVSAERWRRRTGGTPASQGKVSN